MRRPFGVSVCFGELFSFRRRKTGVFDRLPTVAIWDLPPGLIGPRYPIARDPKRGTSRAHELDIPTLTTRTRPMSNSKKQDNQDPFMSIDSEQLANVAGGAARVTAPVSYTHLTLP